LNRGETSNPFYKSWTQSKGKFDSRGSKHFVMLRYKKKTEVEANGKILSRLFSKTIEYKKHKAILLLTRGERGKNEPLN